MWRGKIKTVIVPVIITIVSSVPLGEAAEKIRYSIKFKEGEKYYVRMILEHKVIQTVIDQKQILEAIVGLGYNFNVNNVDKNGNAWIDYTFDWVKVTEKGTMGDVTNIAYDYDSSKNHSPVSLTSQIHAAYLGERFSVKITPRAEVKEVKGLKTMHKNMTKKIGQNFIDHKIQFNEEFIKEHLASPMGIYPNKPVDVGDSWSKTVECGAFPKIGEKWIIVENKWTLKDRRNGVGIIKNKSAIKMSPQAKRQMEETGKMRCDFSGKQYGHIEMQESTGRIIRSKVIRETLVQTEMEAGGSWFKSSPIKTHTVITYGVVEQKKGPVQ